MKAFLTVFVFAFSMASMASDTVEPAVVKEKAQIASILSTYVLFSNKIMAQGLAFGFMPIVQDVNIEFENILEDPQSPKCSVYLTASLAKVEGGKVVPLNLPIEAPTQFYSEDWDCKSVKDQLTGL